MKSINCPLTRKSDILTQEFKTEILIYDLIKNKAIHLNLSSAMVWRECDGKKSVAEISASISKKLKSNFSEDVVWLALNQFETENLLADTIQLRNPLENLSRREVIRRVGFASMVTLPVISALVAPTSLHAQSSGGCFAADNSGNNSAPGCACVGTFDCCGICSAGNVCVNSPRGGAGADPGAAPSCFPFLACFPANNSGSDSAPGCPCIGTFDCCGICSAGGFCTGGNRAAAPGDPGASVVC